MPKQRVGTPGSAASGVSATRPQAADAPGLGLWFPDAHGARYDGTTDDSAAIQAAIDACSAAGGGIVLLTGSEQIQGTTAGARIKINSTLVLKPSVHLKGLGPQTSLTGTANPMIRLPQSTTIPDRITVSDLFLQSPAGKGISLDTTGDTGGNQLGWMRLTIENITIADAVGDAFYTATGNAPIETRWINCVSLRAGGYGFNIGATDDFLLGCTAAQGSTGGFNIGGGNNKLTACKAYGNTTSNYNLVGGGRHMLVSCESQDSAGAGFSLTSGNNTLAGCLSDSDRTVGVGVSGNNNVDVVVMYGGGGSGQTTRVGVSVAGVNNVINLTTSCDVPVSGSAIGNSITVNGSDGAKQSVAYAATVTPAPYSGEFIDVAALTGNITIANPTRYHAGQAMAVRLRQDATGGRTVTWGSLFAVASTMPSAANAGTVFRFIHDGTRWVEQGAGFTATFSNAGLATFTASDSTTVVPNADTGQAWTTVSGVAGISSNALYFSTAPGSGYYDFGVPDGTVSMTFGGTWTGFAPGMDVRYVDANNRISIESDGIFEIVGGVAVQLSDALNIAVNDVIAVTMLGPSITVTKNGSFAASGVMGIDRQGATTRAVDATVMAATKIRPNVGTGQTGVRFDNLTLTGAVSVAGATGGASLPTQTGNASKFLTTNGTAASWSAVSNPLFGNGSDGNVTIAAGTTTLTRDMQYGNLTVNGTLETNGFRVHVKGTLSGAGNVKTTAKDNDQSGGGVPFNAINGYYLSATNASQGGAGGTAAGSNGQTHGFATTLGGVGGAGGTGSGGAGGAAGAINNLTLTTTGVTSPSNLHPYQLWVGHGFNGTAITASYNGGSGGGGGGGDGTSGAGGGQGGGVVVVFAKDASGFTGTISANGGSGGVAAAGNRGGGGGGGGGFAALYAGILPTGSYTLTANGGAGGSGFGTGTAGANGAAGTTVAAVLS